MELPLKRLNPVWMRDRATNRTIGFMFLCPVCSPSVMGMTPHPVMVYSDPTFAKALGHYPWTMRGNSFDNLSVLGNLLVPGCLFRGWISRGRVRW